MPLSIEDLTSICVFLRKYTNEFTKVNVNAGRYIRYESFFVSLRKETHRAHNT